MLIEFGDDSNESLPWRVDEDTLSDIDDPQNRIPERNMLDAAVPTGSLPGTRRDQLKDFVVDYFARGVNRVRGWDSIASDDSIECFSDFSSCDGDWSSYMGSLCSD